MNTGCARITLLLAVLAVGAGCASQQSASSQRAILSAAELESMIRVEVRRIEPTDAESIIAANDQP